MKNKLIASLLAFFGGAIGLHKFYLNDPGGGIFYVFLAMMTGGLFPLSFILGIFDGLRYLMMPPAEFDRKFNRGRSSRGRSTTTVNRRRTQKREKDAYVRNTKNAPRSRSVRSNPFKKSGIKKYKEYDIEGAIEDFQKAIKIDPNDVALYFNLACAYSLMEDKEKAYRYIELAVGKGLKDHQKILSHDDLAYVRIQPEFEDFRKAGYRMNVAQRTQTTSQRSTKSPEQMDDILLAQLSRLAELRKKGVLTEQEFLRERKKVLAR